MNPTINPVLVAAGVLSATAALLHLFVIMAGPRGYQWAGAGNRIVRAAQAGRLFPAVITAGISAVLWVWCAYALSGAGAILPLPCLRPALTAITAIYLLRALLGPFTLVNNGRTARFAWVSSAICLVFGLVHLVGLVQSWGHLGHA